MPVKSCGSIRSLARAPFIVAEPKPLLTTNGSPGGLCVLDRERTFGGTPSAGASPRVPDLARAIAHLAMEPESPERER